MNENDTPPAQETALVTQPPQAALVPEEALSVEERLSRLEQNVQHIMDTYNRAREHFHRHEADKEQGQ